ncbi:hypothetical protein [Lysobacter sp. Root690]|uniref:hypothetical protein n=1 Tax=Lysobacter sp. Root690 TaxID=1736588 RepID=UPI0006F653F8|nr:hypothetical protein [Lysobacter sp. Root690]KRB07885.1 hypothetical protein ASD86_08720 [Lysobacter sp. Root690]
MSRSAEFEGRIVLGMIQHGTAVSAHLTEHELILSKIGGQRETLSIFLRPFSPSMILDLDPQRITDGVFFEVKGTKVGSITHGPLGHPGDGEFDFRDVTSYRLDMKYFFERINVEIGGATAAGIDCLDGRTWRPPMEFSVRFDIPRQDIAEFFKLTDLARDRLLKALDLAASDR